MSSTQQAAAPTQGVALEHCKALIEQHLGWGEAAGWKTQEFEDLSWRMQEKTGRMISATTLKRIWGHVTYTSNPSRHSLDTLAAFLGHDSWRAFTMTLEGDEHLAQKQPSPRKEQGDHDRILRIPRPVLYLCCSIGLLGAAIVFWLGVNGSPDEVQAPIVSSEVVFRSRPVAQGLPNTVIFEYDVRGVTADSFFIQQSWDQQRRARVAPESQTYTAIYYRPGFFNAKLVANDAVLREHPVHVTTEGWLALIEDDPVPVYLQDSVQPSHGTLSVSDEQLRAHGYDIGDLHPPLSFYNVRTFGDLHTDNFSLEAVLRHTANDGRYPCQRAQVTVIGERGAMVASMGIPGCVSDLHVMFSDVYLSGATNDLSAFGVDLSTWQRVLLEVKERNVRVQIGANTPYTVRFNDDIGKVVGLCISFEGNGAVDYVALKDSGGHTVYEDAF